MTYRGNFPSGEPVRMCAVAWELYRAWLLSTPEDDPFANAEGVAYWDHRDNCAECTGRKEIEG